MLRFQRDAGVGHWLGTGLHRPMRRGRRGAGRLSLWRRKPVESGRQSRTNQLGNGRRQRRRDWRRRRRQRRRAGVQTSAAFRRGNGGAGRRRQRRINGRPESTLIQLGGLRTGCAAIRAKHGPRNIHTHTARYTALFCTRFGPRLSIDQSISEIDTYSGYIDKAQHRTTPRCHISANLPKLDEISLILSV